MPFIWALAQEPGPRSESQTGGPRGHRSGREPWSAQRWPAGGRVAGTEDKTGPTTVLGAAWEAGANPLGNGIACGTGGQAGWHPAHRPGTQPSGAWGSGFREDHLRPPSSHVFPLGGGHSARRTKVPPVSRSKVTFGSFHSLHSKQCEKAEWGYGGHTPRDAGGRWPLPPGLAQQGPAPTHALGNRRAGPKPSKGAAAAPPRALERLCVPGFWRRLKWPVTH